VALFLHEVLDASPYIKANVEIVALPHPCNPKRFSESFADFLLVSLGKVVIPSTYLRVV